MEDTALEKLKYPIGTFQKSENFEQNKAQFIQDIIAFPDLLEALVATMTEAQLNTPYRPGGWTIRQLVNHCADSHMNAFVRFKLALTEDNPTIKGYEEQLWALGADYQIDPKHSLAILKHLHYRWSVLLQSMAPTDFKRTYVHSQTGKQADLEYMLSLYSWHCKHHLAHAKLVL